MKEPKDNLQPETIDHVIEDGGLSLQDRQTTRLIQHLYTVSQEYARENEHSLDRIWSRMAQSLEHSVFLPAQWKQPEEKQIDIEEREAMQDNNISWGIASPTYISQPKKRRSFLRGLGISLVAAVAIITIVSFTLFSGVLRSAAPRAGNGSSTITGSAGQQQQPVQQKAISNGKLVCSVGFDVRPLPPFDYTTIQVGWSAQGKIAALTDDNFMIFSAKDCSAKNTKPTRVYEANWSPDGKKLVTASSSNDALDVLDSNGNSIVNIPFTQLGTIFVGQVSWSSDGTKLIFVSQESNHQSSIKSVDAANGGNVKALMKVDGNEGLSGVTGLSPDGKYALLTQFNTSTKQKEHSIWDVNAGKKVSDLPSDNGKGGFSAAVFSPDGSLFAQGGNGKIQIYSTADGKLQSSFEDHDAGGPDDLAWSPDGKYLAASATSINIYDVNAKKIVTTFGQVGAHHAISHLAWAPDGNGLVSSTNLVPDDGHSQTLVNVWALS
ncbi:MAG: PD40 domain-containing protein [Chloroflexi bacterium]|nr:PD40 domain-containing protein [Chloroflexota bacterium]